VSDGSTILVAGFGAQASRGADRSADRARGEDRPSSTTRRQRRIRRRALLKAGRVREDRLLVPRTADSYVFDALYRAGKIELELVPQGRSRRRMRAAGAGIGAFYHAHQATAPISPRQGDADDRGRCVLEHPLCGDVALVKAERGDRWENLVYRKSARNFGPTMASAAKCTIAQVYETVELGALDPECIVTPGIFVTRV